MNGRDELGVNWFLVIVELCRRGYTHQTIAAAIGVPKSTVQGWKQGSEPRYSDGERLVLLWCQVAGIDRAQVPRIGRYDWRA